MNRFSTVPGEGHSSSPGSEGGGAPRAVARARSRRSASRSTHAGGDQRQRKRGQQAPADDQRLRRDIRRREPGGGVDDEADECGAEQSAGFVGDVVQALRRDCHHDDARRLARRSGGGRAQQSEPRDQRQVARYGDRGAAAGGDRQGARPLRHVERRRQEDGGAVQGDARTRNGTTAAAPWNVGGVMICTIGAARMAMAKRPEHQHREGDRRELGELPRRVRLIHRLERERHPGAAERFRIDAQDVGDGAAQLIDADVRERAGEPQKEAVGHHRHLLQQRIRHARQAVAQHLARPLPRGAPDGALDHAGQAGDQDDRGEQVGQHDAEHAHPEADHEQQASRRGAEAAATVQRANRAG